MAGYAREVLIRGFEERDGAGRGDKTGKSCGKLGAGPAGRTVRAVHRRV
jgi:hypothetical protein